MGRRTGHTQPLVYLFCIIFCSRLSTSTASSQTDVPVHPANGEYIKEWLVLGPLFPDDLGTDFLAGAGGEDAIEPSVGDTITAPDGRLLTWKRYRSPGNAVNLTDALGDHDNATAYAYCRLRSPLAGEAGLDLASQNRDEDAVALWINGALFELNLHQGINHCLIKIAHGTGSWGFAARFYPPDAAIITGLVTDAAGEPIPFADIRLYQNNREIAVAQTDFEGHYLIHVYPAHGTFDLSATVGERGTWHTDISVQAGDRLDRNLVMQRAISLSGALRMADGTTPHTAVPVQALRADGPANEAVATVLSQNDGSYRFINLKPGPYRLRCQVLDGYVHYSPSMAGDPAAIVHVQPAIERPDLNFRFPSFKKGTWKSYNTHHGLADNNVFAVDSSADGVLWFGTRTGFVRYDGTGFTGLDHRQGLANDWINTLHTVDAGGLWLGTSGGLAWYNGHTIANYNQGPLADCTVLSIQPGANGTLWFGTSHGVFRYSGPAQPPAAQAQLDLTHLIKPADLANHWVGSLAPNPDGTLWLGTFGGGVYHYDGSRLTNLTAADGLANDWVSAVHRAADGTLWIGTAAGLSHYDGQAFQTLTTADGLVNNSVNAVHTDSAGVVWVGTDGGVSRYDGRTFVNFTTADGLTDNHIWDIFQDREGHLWFGTEAQGILQYDRHSFINFTTADGLVDNDVTALHIEPDGTVWFGTGYTRGYGSGVSRYDGKTFVNFTTADGLGYNSVHSITQTPDGTVWFGTLGGGLSRFDGTGFETLSTWDGLLDDEVEAVHSDSNGVLWLGTGLFNTGEDGGLSYYDGQKFTHVVTTHQVFGGQVSTILRGPDGVVWIGVMGKPGSGAGDKGGVFRLDGDDMVNYTTADGLAGNFVYAIHRDDDGTLWFGTQGGGISRFDGSQFVNFTTADGLPNNFVQQGLIRAADKIIWVGTGHGAAGYDGMTWTSLDTRDGLVGDEIREIRQDPEGYLWFGTKSGVTRYRRSATRPEVHIDSVQTAEGIYTSLAAIIPVAHGTRVRIHYRAIDFQTVPAKRQYRYRFAPGDWSRPTLATTFDTTLAAAGAYTFEVQAINRDLRYSDPVAVRFQVGLPYKQILLTGSFILLSLALVVVGGYARNRQQARRKAETALLQRMQHEMEEARKLQLSMLPKDKPAHPDIDIAWDTTTATEVGGDYYDYHLAADGTLTVILGDATGHGIDAAMVVSATKALFQTLPHQIDLTDILSSMSYALKGMDLKHIGMAVNLVKIKDRVLRVSSAGNPPLLLYRAASQTVEEILIPGMPLGLSNIAMYEQQTVHLAPGDTILLTSDGLAERFNNQRQPLGYPQVERLFGEVARAQPDQIIQHLFQAGEAWAAGRPQDDDITCLVLKVKA